eukprot:TRINITY_DN2317_c0_g1_i3.p1 TRINITY_DN2317_c0_g1~~TRINITY_DN2317_c0_g1_i3.p1  ORF type:complete len:500 (-),score=111.09 TRINITY_DN2317_c0_g1_i3:60-1559(-)
MVTFTISSPTNEFELTVPEIFYEMIYRRHTATITKKPLYELETSMWPRRRCRSPPAEGAADDADHATEQCTKEVSSSLSPTSAVDEAVQSLWDCYLRKNTTLAAGSDIVKESYLLQLVHMGIPDVLRGVLWQTLSGAIYLRESWPNTLVELSDEAITEIERDVPRSMPAHPYYRTWEGKDALRTLLVEYARANSDVGYCQSMNMIAALLLLYMDVQQALRVLHILCAHLFVGYWNRSMKGILVDQQVFEMLVGQHLPQVRARLEQLGVALPIFGFRWFLCLYIHQLPLPVVLRIIDRLFAGGARVLFAVGLAVLQSLRQRLLTCRTDTEIDDVIQSLPDTQVNEDAFFALVDQYCAVIEVDELERLRAQVRPSVLGELTRDMGVDAADLPAESHERITDTFGLRSNRSFDMYVTAEDVARAKEHLQHLESSGLSSCGASSEPWVPCALSGGFKSHSFTVGGLQHASPHTRTAVHILKTFTHAPACVLDGRRRWSLPPQL